MCRINAIVIFATVFVMTCQLGSTQVSTSLKVEEFFDLSYVDKSEEDGVLQSLNLTIPKGETRSPLLIWIGGGAWSYVDKDMEMDFARKVAGTGVAVASVGHRLSAAVWKDPSLDKGIQHPKHVEDIASSVSWLYENADQYGYDTSSIFIGGYSSGAHLAALVTLDRSYLSKHGLKPSIFKGVIPISGTYDIENYYEVFLNGNNPALAEQHVKAVFGDNLAVFSEASPVSFLENATVPMLLMSDNNVYKYSNLFEDRIRDTAFRKVQVVYAYDLSHADLWKDLSFAENSMYRKIIIDFIENKG